MKKYLHFITKPYSISIIKPLIEEIERQKYGKSLIFIPLSMENNIRSDLEYVTSVSEAINFNPDVVFVPGNVVHDKIPGLKVQIFHGLCDEKGGHFKTTGFFDLYCTSGPEITERFIKLSEKFRHFLVRETGWTRVDEILKPFERESILLNLDIDPKKRIVLYAPTFSPKFKSSQTVLPVIKDLPQENEVWIIKFHDLMSRNEKEYIMNLNKDRFRISTQPSIIPLLQVADVLISDTSSVVYEFILLDKPVITINSRSRLEKGINISDITQLREAIDRSIAKPEEYSKNRQRVIKGIQKYRDRQNCKRVLEAVDSVIEHSEISSLRRKPLNIYRKYRVRKKFGYW